MIEVGGWFWLSAKVEAQVQQADQVTHEAQWPEGMNHVEARLKLGLCQVARY